MKVSTPKPLVKREETNTHERQKYVQAIGGTEKSIKEFTHATLFDEWLVKVCRGNYLMYLLPRWKRPLVALGMWRFIKLIDWKKV